MTLKVSTTVIQGVQEYWQAQNGAWYAFCTILYTHLKRCLSVLLVYAHRLVGRFGHCGWGHRLCYHIVGLVGRLGAKQSCHTAGLGGGPGECNGVLSCAHGEAKGLGISIL